ncbi:MAG TPA: bacterial transcriptional activator domain-containing protein [Candidatus Cybelea sp.]|jgi:DNA-binding SARP family transcriptional activator
MIALKNVGRAVTATLEFRFLGAFGIRSGGNWSVGPAPKKGREFIQYLAVHPNRVATRDELAGAFWPELDFDEVSHRIHLAASGARVFLRQLCGLDALQYVGCGYTWNPGVTIVSDVARFIDYTRVGTIESLRAAVDLYAGDFLAGETADWLQPMRVRVAAARASALEAIIEELVDREKFSRALAFGLDLMEAEPGHEHGTRLVMRCFSALGQRARALEQYRLLKTYLAEQIGVEPTAETSRLASELIGTLVA